MRKVSKEIRQRQSELSSLEETIPIPSLSEYRRMLLVGRPLSLSSAYISACALAEYYLEVAANLLEDNALPPTEFKQSLKRTQLRSDELLRALRLRVKG
jgi:hypothetical protein